LNLSCDDFIVLIQFLPIRYGSVDIKVVWDLWTTYL